METVKKLTLTQALREFFEMDNVVLIKELRPLPPEDRDWFCKEFAAIGWEVTRK